MHLVELIQSVAERKHATPAQIALAWILAQKPWIVPIPGTTKLSRLEENLGAEMISLSEQELGEIASGVASVPLVGARLPEAALRMTGR